LTVDRLGLVCDRSIVEHTTKTRPEWISSMKIATDTEILTY